MKRIVLPFLLLFALAAGAQQPQLSKNNEAAGDRSIKDNMICAAATLYKIAYDQYQNDRLLLKYSDAAYKCGDYSKVINAVDSSSTNAGALRLRGLSVFKQALKYNGADADICAKALNNASLLLARAARLGVNTAADLKEIKGLYDERF